MDEFSFLQGVVLWLMGSIVLLVGTWRFTRKQPFGVRLAARTFVLALCFGVVAAGTDAAAIPAPVLVYAVLDPAHGAQYLFAFVAYWIVFAVIYAVVRSGRTDGGDNG